MAKCILITGASGFIGCHTLRPLIELGHKVHTVSSRELDLLDTRSVREFVRKIRPTHLLHLAWLTTPGVFFESPENLRWVESSLALMDAFAEAGGKHFVGAGTCFEYDFPEGACIEGTTPETPGSFYGICKQATSQLLKAFALKLNLSFAWGRIFYLYGPHEREQRLVPSVVRGLLKNESVACSQGNQIRDYLYVQDVADAFIELLESDAQGIFNIGSSKPISLRELVLAFGHALGLSELIQFGARPEIPGEPKCFYADNTKLIRSTHWFPQVSLQDGIEKTITYWRL